VLPQRAAQDWRRYQRTARHHPGATAGAGGASTQICLPGLRGSGDAGARAGAADRGWIADRGDSGPGSGLQICRHLPLYRQAQIYARQGITLDRSTLADWVGRAACAPTLLRARRGRPAPIASEALERIAELYTIESEIRGRSVDERRALRQEESRPILDELEPWLRTKLGLISQKTKLAEAIRYALSRWEGLTRFLDDGRIEIDSNVVERSIRPIAMTDSFRTSFPSV
jgi:hypothetical protein